MTFGRPAALATDPAWDSWWESEPAWQKSALQPAKPAVVTIITITTIAIAANGGTIAGTF